MNDLSKQQLILLALLVSFVTSLATGITTVSLMDQAPKGVIQTINEVVDRTIQEAASTPQSASAGSVAVTASDQIANATAAVSGSVVRLQSAASGSPAGLGLVVSDTGVVITDRSVVAPLEGYTAIMPDGTDVPMAIIQSQNDGDIIFLAPASLTPDASSTPFVPAVIAASSKLGQTVFSLAGTSSPVLVQGIISGVPGPSEVDTTISAGKTLLGSPLFDASGAVIGIRTSTLSTDDPAAFYPLTNIQNAIPKLK